VRTAAETSDLEELQDFCADCYDDPLGFVMGAFPWGEKDTLLELEEGPDANQAKFLSDLGKEVRKARVRRCESGHADPDVHDVRPRHR